MRIASHNVLSYVSKLKFTSKTLETRLKYVLPFSAMDEAPSYVTGHLISLKTQYKGLQVN